MIDKVIKHAINGITAVAALTFIVGACGLQDIDGTHQPIAYAMVVAGMAWIGLRIIATEMKRREEDEQV